MEMIMAQAIRALQAINDTGAAMKAAGVEPDENGQHTFADAVFYDTTLTPEDKIGLLELCDQPNDAVTAQIAELKEMCAANKTGRKQI